jgi:hypothetical protein
MQPVPDSRAHTRQPTYFAGQIAFEGRHLTLKCLVRNLSPAGANLVLPGEYALPREFDLHIASRSQSYRVRLIWCHGIRGGVQFLRRLDPSGDLAASVA